MQNFLAAYQRVVLADRLRVLLCAYRRAKGEPEPARDERVAPADLQAVRLDHVALVRRSVVPLATLRVKRALYTPTHLYTLLQLFRDAEHRFGTPATAPMDAQAQAANQVAWRELRGLLLADDGTLAYRDASLPPEGFWLPLFSHLAREAILWAYASRDAGDADLSSLDASPRSAQHDPAALHPGWLSLLATLMTRLEVDLALSAPTRPGSRARSDRAWDDAHERITAAPPAPTAGETDDAPAAPGVSSLAEIVVTDPFETTFDFKDAERVRHLVVHAHGREGDAADRLGRTLRAFDFSARLLLRFGYTAQTYLARGSPQGALPAVRTALVDGLLRAGFRLRGDPDLGDALAWLAQVNDTGQHFGAAFDRHLNTVAAEALRTFADDQADPLLDAFIAAVADCVMHAPALHVSRWLGGASLAGLDRAHLLAHVSRDDWAAGLATQIGADLTALLARHGDPLARPGRLVFGDLDLAGDRDTYALLTELQQSHSDLCAYARGLARAPRRVRKFFTLLCRGERMGEEADDVLGVADWTRVTEAVCADAQGVVVHYRNTWARLAHCPRATGRAVGYLEALRPLLAPLPGLPPVAEDDHA